MHLVHLWLSCSVPGVDCCVHTRCQLGSTATVVYCVYHGAQPVGLRPQSAVGLTWASAYTYHYIIISELAPWTRTAMPQLSQLSQLTLSFAELCSEGVRLSIGQLGS